jgi:hypothetical protein
MEAATLQFLGGLNRHEKEKGERLNGKIVENKK